MASGKDDFSISGPLHLTSVDWANPDHRRSIAACLVQGIYVLERDRQLEREQALAPLWWEFFHFRLVRPLVDNADSCTFGAIYEYNPPEVPLSIKSLDHSPRLLIAFRGTLTKADSITRDVELDIHVVRNGLHKTTRFEIAMQAVRDMVAGVGSNVWLAGHSLGAAMALLAGKTMAKTGIFLEAYIFNPPFLSPPIERIKNKKVKHGIRIAGSVVTAGLALAMKATKNHQRSPQHDSFRVLSSWVPCLCVNPGDHLCSEYIGYFEHRKKMEEIGAGAIEKIATQNSLGGLVMSAIGNGGSVEDEPLHLIPSAKLTVNKSRSRDFKHAHGIHQWWRQDQELDSGLYLYN